MIRKSILLFLTGLLASTSFTVMALTTHNNNSSCDQGWFAGIGVGEGRLKVSSSTQDVYYVPYSYFDKYTASKTVTTNPIPSVEGGYRWSPSGRLPFVYFLGLRYRYFNANNLQGNILVLNDPAFPYGFSFSTSAQTLSLFGKIDLVKWGQFAPYVTAGVGGAGLKFTNYNEYPKTSVSIARNPAAFASNVAYNFTYDLGIGLDYYLTNCWSASLGYDYVNLGKLKTGSGAYNNIGGTTSSLNLGTVTANTVFLQTDYTFSA